MGKQSKGIDKVGKFKSTTDFPLQKGFYYIVQFKSVMKPLVIPYHFTTRESAMRVIQYNPQMRVQKKALMVFSYVEFKNYEALYKLTHEVGGYTGKWDTLDGLTAQEKHNIRVRNMRRLRRMGLYSNLKGRYSVKKGVKDVKPIATPQVMVIGREKTLAHGIRIEGKPQFLYIITHRWDYQKGPYIFRVRAWKYDIKKRKFTQVSLKIRKTDLLIPYIVPELYGIFYKSLNNITNEKKRSQLQGIFWKACSNPIIGRLTKEQEAAKKALYGNVGKAFGKPNQKKGHTQKVKG